MFLTLEVIDESDEMRATDRLVDRIRQYQQTQIFTLEIFILIIIVSILCNIIADLGIGLLTIELTARSVERYIVILMPTLVAVILVSILSYSFTRKYFGGALSTFVIYKYKVESKTHKSDRTLAEDIWNKIDPLPRWKTPYVSSIATTEKRVMFLLFLSEVLEKERIQKTYNVNLKGEFTYATPSRLWNKLARSKKIDILTLGTGMKVGSCKTSINLNAEKIEKNKFLITFSASLDLKRSFGPELDELVQDVAVYLRSLKNNLYRSLLKISR